MNKIRLNNEIIETSDVVLSNEISDENLIEVSKVALVEKCMPIKETKTSVLRHLNRILSRVSLIEMEMNTKIVSIFLPKKVY